MFRRFIIFTFLFFIYSQANAQTAAVECPSGDRMYMELDNAIRVVIPGVKPELYVVKPVDTGDVVTRQKKDIFWIRPARIHKIRLRIGYKVKGGTKWLRDVEYKVRKPKFELLLGAAPPDRISKGELSSVRSIYAGFTADFPIEGYRIQPVRYEWMIISHRGIATGTGHGTSLPPFMTREPGYRISGALLLFRVTQFTVNGKPASFEPRTAFWHVYGSLQQKHGIDSYTLNGFIRQQSGKDTAVQLILSNGSIWNKGPDFKWTEGLKHGRWTLTAGKSGTSGLTTMEFDYSGDSLRRTAEYYLCKGIYREVIYDSAQPTGTFREYYPSGQLYQEVRFLRNKKIEFLSSFIRDSYLPEWEDGSFCFIGPLKQYHENGKLKTQGQYDTTYKSPYICVMEVEPDPEFTEEEKKYWSYRGTLYFSRRGAWEFYDETGKLISKEKYSEQGYLQRE